MPYAGNEFHVSRMEAAWFRASNTQSGLSLAQRFEDRAAADQRGMETGVSLAKSELRQAEAEVWRTQRELFFYSGLAPHVNTAVQTAVECWPLMSVAGDYIDLLTDREPSGRTFKIVGLISDIAVLAAGEALAPLDAAHVMRDMAHNAERAGKAIEHQMEAGKLAFGGELSRAILPKIEFAPSEPSDIYGSLHTVSSRNGVTVNSSWAAVYGGKADYYLATSLYSFDRLETSSGHVLSGAGVAFRFREEDHNQFQHEPFLAWMNSFNGLSPYHETTIRREVYSERSGAAAGPSPATARVTLDARLPRNAFAIFDGSNGGTRAPVQEPKFIARPLSASSALSSKPSNGVMIEITGRARTDDSGALAAEVEKQRAAARAAPSDVIAVPVE